MNLFTLLQSRAASGHPVRVGLIGAGKFGSMFLAQIPTTNGFEVSVIADLNLPAARKAYATVGWDDARVDVTDAATKLRREMEATFKP